MNKHLSVAFIAFIAASFATYAHDLPCPSKQQTELPGIISLDELRSGETDQDSCPTKKSTQASEEQKHESWASKLLRAMIDDTRSGLKKYLDKLVCHSKK
jgi:hypothetical protein